MKYKIIIDEKLLNIMKDKTKLKTEFFGKMAAIYSDNIHIVFSTMPKKEDILSRFSFKQNSEKHNDELISIRSMLGADFIGVWHSHRNCETTPSKKDLKNFTNNLTISTFGFSINIICNIDKITLFFLGDEGIIEKSFSWDEVAQNKNKFDI